MSDLTVVYGYLKLTHFSWYDYLTLQNISPSMTHYVNVKNFSLDEE